MKITSEKLPASQIRFNVEIEGSDSQSIYDRLLKDLMRSVHVPGFRPGKAPQKMVLRHVGMTSVKASIVEQLIQQALQQVSTENKELSMVGQLTLTPDADRIVEILRVGEALQFSFTSDLTPEVIVKDYRNLSVKAEKVEPDFTKIDRALHNFRLKNATLVPVEDRGVQVGDVVTIDYVAVDVSTGQIFDDYTDYDAQFPLDDETVELEIFQPVVGMRAGETRIYIGDFSIEEDSQTITLEVTYTLHEIKYPDLPPLDDAFAQNISDFETLAELRQHLADNLIVRAKEATKENIKIAIVNALVPCVEVDPPVSMINAEIKRVLYENIELLQHFAGLDIQKLSSLPESNDAIRTLLELSVPIAHHRLKKDLALLEIAYQEGLEEDIDAKDLSTHVREVLADPDTKSLDPDAVREFLLAEMLKSKALEWLEQNSQVELVPEGSLEEEEEVLEANAEATSSETEALEANAEAIPSETEALEADAEAIPSETEALETDAEATSSETEVLEANAEATSSETEVLEANAEATSSETEVLEANGETTSPTPDPAGSSEDMPENPAGNNTEA